MNRLIYINLLVPLLPLVGALWNRVAVMVLTGLAWAALLGAILIGEDASQQFLLVAQFPLLIFMTWMSLHLSKKRRALDIQEAATSEMNEFEAVVEHHRILKEAVTKSEKIESQSLQIYSVAKALAEALSWKDLVPRLTSGIQKLFGAHEFLLYAFNEQDELKLLHKRGSWSKAPPVKGSLPTLTTHVQPSDSYEVVPVLAIPIEASQSHDQQRGGYLFLKSSRTDHTEEDLLKIGKEFGENLGMTLNKAFLFAQMETQLQVDGLTGVLRRQTFMERLAQEFKRAAVFHTPFSLIMVDIDHFKSVNDSHGHSAGDAVLTRLGHVLKESVYETDVVARYGGEEFIILMPKADPEGVLRKAEFLRKRIEEDPIVCGFETLHVTVCLGVAHFPTHARSSQHLIEAADQAMYQAKESGRNRVVEASS